MSDATTTTQTRPERPVITVTGTMTVSQIRTSEKVDGGFYGYSRIDGEMPGTKLTAFTAMAFDCVEAFRAMLSSEPTPVKLIGSWARNVFLIQSIEHV